jgi:hypothetical protein
VGAVGARAVVDGLRQVLLLLMGLLLLMEVLLLVGELLRGLGIWMPISFSRWCWA